MARNVDITKLRKRVASTEAEVKKIQNELKAKAPRPKIKDGTCFVELKKPFITPNFQSKTVLTDSTWDYVLTYLQRSSNEEAVFYWEQAKNFYHATLQLDIISAPLTTYYCFLNATKALLKAKKITFDTKHGVSGERITGHVILQNERVKIHTSGVLSGLCVYLKEPVSSVEEYCLKDILYNLAYIHRAYTLTFKDTELYIPIFNPSFVHDSHRKEGWFQFELEQSYSNKSTLNKLTGYGVDNYYDNSQRYILRRNKTFKWETTRNKPTAISSNSFANYYKKIRNDLLYIYSPNELWYIKRKDLTNRIINRNTMVLTMAAMHRLSELSRYEPQTLKKHLEKEQSWLLREFINKSILQFVDNISSEITGVDFRQTGFRN